jgi:hypothetical protein
MRRARDRHPSPRISQNPKNYEALRLWTSFNFCVTSLWPNYSRQNFILQHLRCNFCTQRRETKFSAQSMIFYILVFVCLDERVSDILVFDFLVLVILICYCRPGFLMICSLSYFVMLLVTWHDMHMDIQNYLFSSVPNMAPDHRVMESVCLITSLSVCAINTRMHFTNFANSFENCRSHLSSRRQQADMKQVPFWGSTGVSLEILAITATWRPGIVPPCFHFQIQIFLV